MNRLTVFRTTLLAVITSTGIHATSATQPPRIAVIFVIDQCSYPYFKRLAPHFKHGIEHLLSHGTEYTQAYYAHAMPATAPGHAALSTGCLPHMHGIIGNKWYDARGTKIECDDDPSKTHYVFNDDTKISQPSTPSVHSATIRKQSTTFKSAAQLMADTISDQVIAANSHNKVFAISSKSRSAIMMAGHGGVALWQHDKKGPFTSSTAFVKELPSWVKTFNADHFPKTMTWQLTYPASSRAYHMQFAHNYEFSGYTQTLIGRSISTDTDLFYQSPFSSTYLLNLARECLKNNITDQTNRLLLWVSFSGVDSLAHSMGPDSIEYTDSLYHLDKELGSFIKDVERMTPDHKPLFVLTADHGGMPIPELLSRKGLNAHRINTKDLVRQLNQRINALHGIPNIVVTYKTPQFFLDMKRFLSLSPERQQRITRTIKQHLLSIPGIKNVWTPHDISTINYSPYSIEYLFKNQFFPGRSGYITVQTYPYTQLSDEPTGTKHATPYKYDTHVPLIIAHPQHEPQKITRKVWLHQLANTVARIINVPGPSASTVPALPDKAL